jgi:repressor LexA
MRVTQVLYEILKVRGWTQEQLAERLGTTQATVSRWLKGAEPRGSKLEEIRLLARESGLLDDAPAERQVIPIMGYVGAGGDVEPDFEQVPDDGLDQVELPYVVGIVGDPVGFAVRGESMQPKYSAGEIVIVEREQPWSIDSMIGDYAVVLTYEGRRFIKKIMPGAEPHTYDLVSVNGPTIESVRLRWASPVRLVIPPIGLKRVRPAKGTRAPARRQQAAGRRP